MYIEIYRVQMHPCLPCWDLHPRTSYVCTLSVLSQAPSACSRRHSKRVLAGTLSVSHPGVGPGIITPVA